jgi:hypothetical protein
LRFSHEVLENSHEVLEIFPRGSVYHISNFVLRYSSFPWRPIVLTRSACLVEGLWRSQAQVYDKQVLGEMQHQWISHNCKFHIFKATPCDNWKAEAEYASLENKTCPCARRHLDMTIQNVMFL